MTDLTPDHPAVEAAAERFRTEMMGPNWTRPWAELGERAKRKWRSRALAALTAALPHLTADDLRDTPAGRALMAEAWEEGALHQARGSAETRRVLASALPNPYKETPDE